MDRQRCGRLSRSASLLRPCSTRERSAHPVGNDTPEYRQCQFSVRLGELADRLLHKVFVHRRDLRQAQQARVKQTTLAPIRQFHVAVNSKGLNLARDHGESDKPVAGRASRTRQHQGRAFLARPDLGEWEPDQDDAPWSYRRSPSESRESSQSLNVNSASLAKARVSSRSANQASRARVRTSLMLESLSCASILRSLTRRGSPWMPFRVFVLSRQRLDSRSRRGSAGAVRGPRVRGGGSATGSGRGGSQTSCR